MKILVTGGAGFIGSHIVDALCEEGHKVVIYDNLDPQVHKHVPEHLNPAAKFVREDIRDSAELYQIVRDVDMIFHQAAAVGVGQSMYQVDHYIDVNTRGTGLLLDMLVNKEHSVKKLIVASSMSVYGEGAYKCDEHGTVYPSGRSEVQLEKKDWNMKCPICSAPSIPAPTSESAPLSPTSIYAISKRDQEEMCMVIGKTYGIPVTALRYFNVYGPRQSLNNPYTGVAAIFQARIKNGNKPLLFEDGRQSRDFVSVHDIVAANLLVLKNNSADYQIFNVGTGIRTDLIQIVETLVALYNKEALGLDIFDEYRKGDIRDCYADISKIKSLGYEPKYDFETGMKELVNWGIAQKSSDGYDVARTELDRHRLVG